MLNQNLLLGDAGYNIQRSLRFRSSASAYLNRTPASAGNRKTWTWSGWVKRGALSTTHALFTTGANSTNRAILIFQADDTIAFSEQVGGVATAGLTTTQVFRDPSSWYHIILQFDSTQATSTNRLKMYVNGSQITAFSGTTYPSLNQDSWVNAAADHFIGRASTSAIWYLDGYLTEINFIDGQALTPSSFGETDSVTGVWKPKKYAGTYGTNGFYLNFSDNSSNTATTIGKDYSGNGNNWTPNNISVTAGSTYDSMTDVPTLTSPTAANYCVLNPLSTGRTVSQGNMYYAGSATGITKGTIGVSSGKWYWEFTGSDTGASAGVADITLSPTRTYLGDTINGWMYISGTTYNNNTGTGGRPTFTTGDVIGVAVDVDSGKLWFSKNGTWIASGDPATGANAVYSNLSGYTLTPASGSNTILDAGYLNCGQRPFSYTPPTGFVALNTFNLPDATIKAGNKHFDVLTYSGNSGTQSITGLNFQPDFVWLKSRSTGATNHLLEDVIRGTKNSLLSNDTSAELARGINAFLSNGFSFNDTAGGDGNVTGSTYVGWNWKAGGSAVSNTAGTITSTVSANPSAGFSVVTFTAQSSGSGTVGHGLGVAPKFIITKSRTQTYGWAVYHTSIGNTGYVTLNTTNAVTTNTIWNNTSPTSSVFSLGSDFAGNDSCVAYCFSEVAGYSKFGSYTGTGSTDGPFLYCGFRPRFLLIKRTDAARNWFIYDTARSPSNEALLELKPNLSDAEATSTGSLGFDILSNGFKVRTNQSAYNESTATYIFMALAENPFKYSLAR